MSAAAWNWLQLGEFAMLFVVFAAAVFIELATSVAFSALTAEEVQRLRERGKISRRFVAFNHVVRLGAWPRASGAAQLILVAALVWMRWTVQSIEFPFWTGGEYVGFRGDGAEHTISSGSAFRAIVMFGLTGVVAAASGVVALCRVMTGRGPVGHWVAWATRHVPND